MTPPSWRSRELVEERRARVGAVEAEQQDLVDELLGRSMPGDEAGDRRPRAGGRGSRPPLLVVGVAGEQQPGADAERRDGERHRAPARRAISHVVEGRLESSIRPRSYSQPARCPRRS